MSDNKEGHTRIEINEEGQVHRRDLSKYNRKTQAENLTP